MAHYKAKSERMEHTLRIRLKNWWWDLALNDEPGLVDDVREYIKRKYVDRKILKERIHG